MFLERILRDKRLEVAARAEETPLSVLERLAARAPDPRDFPAALRPGPRDGEAPAGPVPVRPGTRAARDGRPYDTGGDAGPYNAGGDGRPYDIGVGAGVSAGPVPGSPGR